MIIAGTGHRELSHPEAALRQEIENCLKEVQPEYVVVGMASGFDLILGDVCYQVKQPYIAVAPWLGHTPRVADENLYYGVWNFAAEHFYTSDSEEYPGAWVYQKRNTQMIDMATHVLAYYDGRDSGGTKNAIWYAGLPRVQKPVRNIFDRIPPF